MCTRSKSRYRTIYYYCHYYYYYVSIITDVTTTPAATFTTAHTSVCIPRTRQTRAAAQHELQGSNGRWACRKVGSGPLVIRRRHWCGRRERKRRGEIKGREERWKEEEREEEERREKRREEVSTIVLNGSVDKNYFEKYNNFLINSRCLIQNFRVL